MATGEDFPTETVTQSFKLRLRVFCMRARVFVRSHPGVLHCRGGGRCQADANDVCSRDSCFEKALATGVARARARLLRVSTSIVRSLLASLLSLI